MSVVCDCVCRAIGPSSVVFSTLGGKGPTACGTLNLVSHATGSYCSLVDGIFGTDGADNSNIRAATQSVTKYVITKLMSNCGGFSGSDGPLAFVSEITL